MYQYSSNITFLYYNDLNYGTAFLEEILKLKLRMDQGWAKVYQVNETSFIGIVQLKESKKYRGNTLVSFNTSDVLKEYDRISKLNVSSLTEIQFFESIPLKSFFFKDDEGHDFEVQQFMDEKDLAVFG